MSDKISRERLKQRRQELNMTLEDLGNLIGVGKSTVRKWETGDIENMKTDKLSILSKALKVSPLWLMGLDVPMDKEQPILSKLDQMKQELKDVKFAFFGDVEDFDQEDMEDLRLAVDLIKARKNKK